MEKILLLAINSLKTLDKFPEWIFIKYSEMQK